MKKLVMTFVLIVLSGCAGIRHVQTYDGPPRPRDEVSVLLTELPDAYNNTKNYTSCGYITGVDGKFFGGKSTVELLPGNHAYWWEHRSVDYLTHGNGRFSVGKNEVIVLVCKDKNYGLIKMPFKYTDTDINKR